MGSVKRRAARTAGGQVSWRARWTDPAGRERSRTFARKVDAERFLVGVEGDMLRGQYVDLSAGRTTVAEYAERWRGAQLQHRASTAAAIESRLRVHVLPAFGHRPVGAVTRSEVQGWVKERAQAVAPSTARAAYRVLAMVFGAAVRDRLVAVSPCDRVALPEAVKLEVRPLTPHQVLELAGAMPARYGAVVVLAAGTGLRLSEVLGLTRERVDFLRRVVHVREQLVCLPGGEPFLGPPKTAASVRSVPAPAFALEALSQHLAAYGAPGAGPGSPVFTSERGEWVRRTGFGARWRRGVAAAGLPVGTRFHVLRHTYASLLIAQGEHPKTIQRRLGHASITETMDTYGHLFPDAEDRTREAIEAAWRAAPAAGTVQGRSTGEGRPS